MAVSAAIGVASIIAGGIQNNQAAQRQKGLTAQLTASIPDPTLTAPPSTAQATQQSITNAAAAAAQQRRRALGAYGMNDTILTSPRGLPGQAQTTRHTLLGQ